MLYFVLVFLFIAQILSFYFIILLNVKISRLKDIEKSQERLKDEIDQATSIYLAEMRDENDRLIGELKKIRENRMQDTKSIINEPLKEEKSDTITRKEKLDPPNFNMPRNLVAKAYQDTSAKVSTKEIPDSVMEQRKKLTIEEEVRNLHQNGKNIDEIAKMLQKGRTEIELLLKFQH
ncbi:hypothetical protein ACWV26_04775 [Rummeliibacillus sp. JY-2-4R]